MQELCNGCLPINFLPSLLPPLPETQSRTSRPPPFSTTLTLALSFISAFKSQADQDQWSIICFYDQIMEQSNILGLLLLCQQIIQSFLMLVQFQRVNCLKHNLPLSFICSDMSCSCLVRLCQICGQEHQKKKQKDQELLKDTVYCKKMEIEIEIIQKQYGHFENYKTKDQEVGLLNSKNQENIQNVEYILKVIKEEKIRLLHTLEEFNFNHFEVKKKLAKIKGNSSGNYLASLRNNQISPLASRMLSEIGLERLRKKVVAAHGNNQKYQDFVNAVKKYGNTSKEFVEGLGFKGKQLIINRLNLMLSQWRGDRRVEVCLDQRMNYAQKQRTDSKSKNRVCSQSPRRRVNVFTGKVYTVNTGKEN